MKFFENYFARIHAKREAKQNAAIAAMSEPFCGNRREHYFWIEVQLDGCPICSGIRRDALEKQIRDRDNAELARAVVDEFLSRCGETER